MKTTFEVGQQVEIRPSVTRDEFRGQRVTVTKVFKNGNVEVTDVDGTVKDKYESHDLRPYLTPSQRHDKAMELVERALTRIEDRINEPQVALDELRAKFAACTGSLATLIRWEAEAVFDAEAKIHLYAELGVARRITQVRAGEKSLADIAMELVEREEELRRYELESPYRHSSTCPMSNFEEERKHYARCQVLSQRYGGSLATELRGWVKMIQDVASGEWNGD